MGNVMQKKVFHISDMHCPTCVIRLESIEDELPGITSIKASYIRQILEVEWNNDQVNEEQIRQAIRDKGYQVI
jgi:copper chaperone CopZ